MHQSPSPQCRCFWHPRYRYSTRPSVRNGKVEPALYKVPGSMSCQCNNEEDECPEEDKRTFLEKLRDAGDNLNDILQKMFPDPNSQPKSPYTVPGPWTIPGPVWVIP